MGKLRIHAAIPDMPDNLHDQGIAVLDPNIFRDCQNFLQWWNGPIGKISPTGRAAFWAYLLYQHGSLISVCTSPQTLSDGIK